MMEPNRILTRDLKLILAAAVEMLRDPAAVDRMLQICARTESATQKYMAEQHELRCMRDEHRQFLARAGKEHDERLAQARREWAVEEQERRRKLQFDEDEAARRRAWAGQDRAKAAALRERLERRAHKLGESVAEAACEHGSLPGCDSVIEQRPPIA
jgi:hypothetical protein